MNISPSDAKDFCINFYNKAREENHTREATLNHTINDSLTINFPGKKVDRNGVGIIGDYVAVYRNKEHTHAELAKMFSESGMTVNSASNFLAHIYQNGTKPYFNEVEESFQDLVFWVSLQEEINYPENSGFKGRKLALSRYFEGVLSSQPSCNVSLDAVIKRAKERGRPPCNSDFRTFMKKNQITIPNFYY